MEDQAALDASKKAKELQAKNRLGKAATNQNSVKSSKSPAFTAKFSITDPNRIRLTVTDNCKGQKSRQWDVDVNCLLCKKTIEKANNVVLEHSDTQALTVNSDMKEKRDEDGLSGITPPTTPLDNASEDSVIASAVKVETTGLPTSATLGTELAASSTTTGELSTPSNK